MKANIWGKRNGNGGGGTVGGGKKKIRKNKWEGGGTWVVGKKKRKKKWIGGLLGKKGKGNERRIKNRKGKTKLVLFVSLFYWV